MTSIYSITSIETRLVTHFSGYKRVTLHEKAMLYVLNHNFHFFCLLKYCKILWKYSFCIGYSDILNKLETIGPSLLSYYANKWFYINNIKSNRPEFSVMQLFRKFLETPVEEFLS